MNNWKLKCYKINTIYNPIKIVPMDTVEQSSIEQKSETYGLITKIQHLHHYSARRNGEKEGTETGFEEIITENVPNLEKTQNYRSKKPSELQTE